VSTIPITSAGAPVANNTTNTAHGWRATSSGNAGGTLTTYVICVPS
jgi:hypothetical protein